MSFSAIVKFIMAIPQVLSALREIARMIEEYQRRKAVKEAQEAVDETTRTGDQRREEAALGGDGGPTKNPLPGLGERPVRKR